MSTRNQKFTYRTRKFTNQQAETSDTQPEFILSKQKQIFRYPLESIIRELYNNHSSLTKNHDGYTVTDGPQRTGRPGSWTDEVTKGMKIENRKKSNDAPDVSHHLSQNLKWEVCRPWEHHCMAHWPPQQIMEPNLPVREALCSESHDCKILDRSRAP
jgi:hypothetical protein